MIYHIRSYHTISVISNVHLKTAAVRRQVLFRPAAAAAAAAAICMFYLGVLASLIPTNGTCGRYLSPVDACHYVGTVSFYKY
jgi:hypothetical protein